MQPQELVKAGRLPEALRELEQNIRKNPADAKLRFFLFQLLAVMGNWKRAADQLSVSAEMDPALLLDVQLYGPAMQAEAFRAEVFRGERAPLIFGEPEAWLGWLVQAAQLQAQGKHAQANELRAKALDEAPAHPGKADGKAFQWIMDADARLGPTLECVLNGKYYWVPMHRIAKVTFDVPKDLRDLVWAQAHFTWTNGGEVAGLVPVRYAGSESSDSKHALSKQTDWSEVAEGVQQGLGQRLLATDDGDLALLEVRELVFDAGVSAAGGGASTGASHA